MKEKEIKYKTNYNHRDNRNYIPKVKEPVLTYTERVFNSVTETYEYIEKIINYAQEWKGQMLALEAEMSDFIQEEVRKDKLLKGEELTPLKPTLENTSFDYVSHVGKQNIRKKGENK